MKWKPNMTEEEKAQWLVEELDEGRTDERGDIMYQWEMTHKEEMAALSSTERLKIGRILYQTTLTLEELNKMSVEEILALRSSMKKEKEVGGMTKQEIMNELYDTCRNMTADDFFKLMKEANSDEEKSFYVTISDFFLQLQQKEVIKNEVIKKDSMVNKHKMLIEFDREKIEREQIYDIEALEACIAERFAASNIYKDEKGYYGGSFEKLGAVTLDLMHLDWFLDNAKTWLWLTLENDTDNPTDDDYSAEDFLIQFRRFREEDKKQMAHGNNKTAMYKVFIKMDYDKLEKEDITKEIIDDVLLDIFAEKGIEKDSDGFFVGGTFEAFWSAILYLSEDDLFMDNVKTWEWYASNGSSDDYSVENLLERYQKERRKKREFEEHIPVVTLTFRFNPKRIKNSGYTEDDFLQPMREHAQKYDISETEYGIFSKTGENAMCDLVMFVIHIIEKYPEYVHFLDEWTLNDDGAIEDCIWEARQIIGKQYNE